MSVPSVLVNAVSVAVCSLKQQEEDLSSEITEPIIRVRAHHCTDEGGGEYRFAHFRFLCA